MYYMDVCGLLNTLWGEQWVQHGMWLFFSLCVGASRYVPGGLSSQPGIEMSRASDPFTGAGRYQPQTWSSGSTSVPSSGMGGAVDPFTGESAYNVCATGILCNVQHAPKHVQEF